MAKEAEHEVRKFCCSVCSKKFKQKHHLMDHQLTVHSEERPSPCTTCNKKFKCRGNLKTHARVHSESRPFPYGVCRKTFKTAVEVRLHSSRLHSNSRPFHCKESQCRSNFRTRPQLRIHALVHSTVMPAHRSAVFVRSDSRIPRRPLTNSL